MNLIHVTKQFASEEECLDYLVALRWPEGIRCPQCNGAKVSKITRQKGSKNKRTRIYQCLTCKGFQFSVTAGSIFSDSHLPLRKWFMAVALICDAKKGLSAKQMQRDLKTAYKTAWYLNHRIRKAMALLEAVDDQKLVGTVEADETFIGSKKYDKRRKRAKYDKEPVFGMVERGGRAKTFHIPEVNRFYVIDKIKDNIAITADHVYTDDSR